MATSVKTIEYAFALATGTVASTTARDFAQIAALAIPETSSRTFRSVILEVSCLEEDATAGDLTAVLLGIQLGAVARSDATVTQTITNSGENQSFLFSRDVTSYFVTNYTGTSMTSDCRLTVTGRSTNNATAKLIITYEYDDTSTTQIKTVKIPIDGNLTSLSTSFANVGQANQWPVLNTFLPETSKVYRKIWFEIETNEATTAASGTDPSLDMRYDGVTTVSDGLHQDAAVSARWYRRLDVLDSLDTSVIHTVEAKSSQTGMLFGSLTGVICVTYEFASSSTAIINSVQLPLHEEEGFAGGSTSADLSRIRKIISIQEPGTIALVQSGVIMSYIDAGGFDMDIRGGSQAARVFTHLGTVRAGGVTAGRRMDAGSVGGVAGITIAKGFNTFTLDYFSDSTINLERGSTMTGVLYLNYTSGKASTGLGAHNRTVRYSIEDYFVTSGFNQVRETAAVAPIIPETNFWSDVGFQMILLTNSTSLASLGLELAAENLSGEGPENGWRHLWGATRSSDAECGPMAIYADGNGKFDRYTQDQDTTRLAVETARKYRMACSNSNSGNFQIQIWVTYHTLSSTLSGNVRNYTGDGSAIKVDAHRVDTGEKINTVNTSVGGGYTMKWYDSAATSVFVHAQQDTTHLGRGANGTPVQDYS
jgi:hypothetical protein